MSAAPAGRSASRIDAGRLAAVDSVAAPRRSDPDDHGRDVEPLGPARLARAGRAGPVRRTGKAPS